MANVTYNKGKAILGGSADWSSGAQTYRALLTTGAYVPNPDDDFVAAVTNELSGGGYARVDVVNRSIAENTVDDRADYMADNPQWTGLSSVETLRWLVLYRFNTNDGDNELIVALDAGALGINLTGLTEWTARLDGQLLNGRAFSIT